MNRFAILCSALRVAGTVNKISSGVGSVSRLGFRGTEDLSDGLSAIYLLEMGTKIDTGEIDTVPAPSSTARPMSA